MSLWGVVPLLAVVLLGGSGAHATGVSGRLASTSSPSPVPSAAPPAGSTAPGPVLWQAGPTTWKTTIVLLNDTSPACRTVKAAQYWLATTSPDQTIKGGITGTTAILATSPAATKPGSAATQSAGSSCEVRLSFPGPAQTPETAALVINRAGMSSSITLIVSRDVTLTDYIWIPAIAGGVMALLLFFFSVLFVKVYDWDGTKLTGWTRAWWSRPILGSGAWTLNDSWATNISTGLVAVGAILAVTTAANSLFPGIALDRFAIVNIAAGAIVVAAPAVFGILYSWFTARNPGPTADATVKLPDNAVATIEVPSGASVTMSGDATVRESAGERERVQVRAGCTYQVPPGTVITVQAGEQAVLWATVQQVAKAAVREAARAAVREAWRLGATAAIEAAVEAGNAAAMHEAARATARAVVMQAGQADVPPMVAAQADTAALKQLISQEAARAVKLAVAPAVNRAVRRQVVQVVTQAVLQAVRQAGQPAAPPADHADAVRRIAEAARDATRNAKREVEIMAFPGTGDIGVRPGNIVLINAPVGTWTIQASDQLSPPARGGQQPAPPPPPAPAPWWWPPAPSPTAPADVTISYPARIEAPGGVKVTAVGTADVTFPEGTVIAAPRRGIYKLKRPRRLLTPQGSNVLVANMGMLVIANILTMFGIGAEIGVAFVLAHFSEATQPGLGFIFGAIAAVALLVFVYARTAVRTMADPQPGSSISSQAGTSFTL